MKDFLKEFDKRFDLENAGAGAQGNVRNFLQEAITAAKQEQEDIDVVKAAKLIAQAKQEGRAEAVAYIEKRYMEAERNGSILLLRRDGFLKVLENATKEEKV